MKMTTGKKRLVAVLLAVMMVLSVVPFAALAVNAESTLPINGEEIFSGQTVMPSSPVTYDYGISTSSVQIMENTYVSAVLTEKNIDGVIAAAVGDLSGQAVIPSVSGASVYFTSKATKTSAQLVDDLKSNDAYMEADYKYDIKSFSTSYRNQLESVRISYSGREVKDLYLYAKISTHVRTFGNNSVVTADGETYYDLIGKVTVYPTSLSLTLTYPSDRIAVNQTTRIIASVNTAMNVKYDITAENVSGLASVKEAASGKGIFEVTANGMVTSGNRLTVYAYLRDSADKMYIYRKSDGALEKNANPSYTSGGRTYYCIRDYRTVSFSTVSPITSVQFRESFYSCEVGDSFYTGVTIKPTGATGGITYTSSNPSIATISSSGYVTALAEGQTIIYATAADGSGAFAAAAVTVKKATAKVALNSSSMTMAKGEKATLTAIVLPDTLTNKSVYWTSSNSAIASVSSTGEVTAVGEGTAVITATYTGNSKKSASCVVTVTKPLAKITISEVLSVKVGETVNLNASISEIENKTLMYSSDNTSVVKVDTNGNITGVKAGTAMITVISVANTSVRGYCVVTVTGESGVIKETTKYVANSKYYRSSDVSSADVKTAIAQLKGAKSIDVTVDVISESDMNKVVITRYAAARLAKYADSLTVKVDDKKCVFDSADLAKMDIGRPVYVYVTPDKVTVKYKKTSGVYKTIKVTPEVTEK